MWGAMHGEHGRGLETGMRGVLRGAGTELVEEVGLAALVVHELVEFRLEIRLGNVAGALHGGGHDFPNPVGVEEGIGDLHGLFHLGAHILHNLLRVLDARVDADAFEGVGACAECFDNGVVHLSPLHRVRVHVEQRKRRLHARELRADALALAKFADGARLVVAAPAVKRFLAELMDTPRECLLLFVHFHPARLEVLLYDGGPNRVVLALHVNLAAEKRMEQRHPVLRQVIPYTESAHARHFLCGVCFAEQHVRFLYPWGARAWFSQLHCIVKKIHPFSENSVRVQQYLCYGADMMCMPHTGTRGTHRR